MIFNNKIQSLSDLTPEEQGGLVVYSLKKGETIIVGERSYLVTKRTDHEIKVKDMTSGKNGTILHAGSINVAWMKTRKDDSATRFFRDIESDITKSLLDENNPFGPIQTASYIQAKRRLEEMKCTHIKEEKSINEK